MRLLFTLLFFRATVALALPGNNAIFVQNKGQWPADVRFRVDVPGGFLFLKEQSLHYVFYDTKALADRHAIGTQPLTDAIRAHGVDMQLTGSQSPSRIEGSKPADASLNYFLGNDPAAHVSHAPAFGEVIYHDIYLGIDLRLFAFYETLKYEFTVRPGADPGQIRLTYDGADAVKLTGGKLAIQTSVTTFQEKEPYSYVSHNGRATDVKTDWTLAGNEARFALPNGYDKSQPLTIDPELVFVTYSGARSDNWANTATYDADGNLYSGGSVFGANFPVTTGAYQVNFGGLVDVALLKFSPDGTKLLYGTFLGGRNADLPHSLVVNNAGELVVMGTTSSPDFPITAGSYQPAPGLSAGSSLSFVTSTRIDYTMGSDLFLVKLSASGQQLIAGTFVGGTGNDGVGINPTRAGLVLRNYGDDLRGEVTVGPDDNVYVASVTASPDFPVTDKSTAKGGLDAVVFQLSADLKQLRWSARLGGSAFDGANGLKLTASGTLYVCGVTSSSDLPTTAAALLPKAPGSDDGFVARFDNQRLTQLTYLGTAQADGAYLIDTGPDGNPYVFGLSRGGTYPVSAGVFSSAGSGQFIQALDPNLTKALFSTVIGSGRPGPDISPTAFLVNECGNIYVAGWGGLVNTTTGYNAASNTKAMPISDSTYQSVTNGSNFWIGVLEKGAKSLLYGTFLGGTASGLRGDHVDGGTCRFDKNGVIYHAACVCGGSTFPPTPTAWSKTNNSTNCNNVAFKFDTDKLKASFDTYAGTRKNVVEGCTPLVLDFKNTSVGGKRYEWDIAGLAKSTNPTQTSFTFTQGGQYVVTLRAYNPLTCKVVDSTQQTITIRPAAFSITPDTTICAGRSVQLVAQGGTMYRWAAVAGLSSTTLANPIATPATTTTYSVTITNAFGCSAVKTQTIREDVSFTPMVSVKTSVDCGQPMQLTFSNSAAGADRYVWTLGNGDTLRVNAPANYTYAESGRYTVTVTAYKNSCPISATVNVAVENLSRVPNVITANNDGKNDVFTIGFPDAKLQIVNRWGRLIYESAHYQNDWGRDVPNGMYFFVLTTPGGIECKGWLEVLQ